MTKNFFERLDKYMEYKDLTDYKITVETGVAVGTIGRQRKANRCLSMESIEKILSTYTDLNAVWLITGEGRMLYEETESEKKLSEKDMKPLAAQSKKENNDVNFLKDIIRTLQDTVASQQKTIATLTVIIERSNI